MPIKFAPTRTSSGGGRNNRGHDGRSLSALLTEALERARTLVDVPPWSPSVDEAECGELGQHVEHVIAELRRQMHFAANDPTRMATICEVALTLQQLAAKQQQILVEDRIRSLGSMRQRMRFAGHNDPASLLRAAAEAACRASGLDRAMVFKIDSGRLHATSTYFSSNQEWAADCQTRAEQIAIPLVPGVLEAEVVRRRMPALVSDAQQEPQAYQPIVGMLRTQAYVASPIFVNGQIEATLHLDAYDSGRELDAFDRDIAAELAFSIGQALERVLTLQQLMRQRAVLETLTCQTEAQLRTIVGSGELTNVAMSHLTVQPDLVHEPATGENRAARSLRLVRNLTRRELEVLQLMSTGATNADIAAQLFLAEGTIKTHVKRILRKLNVGNRGQAVAHYTTVMQNRGHL
ncbi:putative GAF sensor protein [Mycobacterium sp. PO1]|nr:putative GAF sensor protein [Mycobacterium sp. PO1]GFM25557.1 putative GAF sensor protein [Mycobacterium sp. PO2]